MNNYINFYYELYPDDIVKKGNHYYFVLNNEKYYFVTYDRDVNEVDTLYKLNKEMISRNSLVHEIILNKKGEVITLIDEVYYVLLRVYVNESVVITIDDVVFMLNSNDGVFSNSVISRTDWIKLWSLCTIQM